MILYRYIYSSKEIIFEIMADLTLGKYFVKSKNRMVAFDVDVVEEFLKKVRAEG